MGLLVGNATQQCEKPYSKAYYLTTLVKCIKVFIHEALFGVSGVVVSVPSTKA